MGRSIYLISIILENIYLKQVYQINQKQTNQNNKSCKFSDEIEEIKTESNLIDAHEWDPKVKNVINFDTSLLDQ